MRTLSLLACAIAFLLVACAGKSPYGECTPECLRNVRCVTSCGGTVLSDGCCPCTAGSFDDIVCGADGGTRDGG